MMRAVRVAPLSITPARETMLRNRASTSSLPPGGGLPAASLRCLITVSSFCILLDSGLMPL